MICSCGVYGGLSMLRIFHPFVWWWYWWWQNREYCEYGMDFHFWCGRPPALLPCKAWAWDAHEPCSTTFWKKHVVHPGRGWITLVSAIVWHTELTREHYSLQILRNCPIPTCVKWCVRIGLGSIRMKEYDDSSQTRTLENGKPVQPLQSNIEVGDGGTW